MASRRTATPSPDMTTPSGPPNGIMGYWYDYPMPQTCCRALDPPCAALPRFSTFTYAQRDDFVAHVLDALIAFSAVPIEDDIAPGGTDLAEFQAYWNRLRALMIYIVRSAARFRFFRCLSFPSSSTSTLSPEIFFGRPTYSASSLQPSSWRNYTSALVKIVPKRSYANSIFRPPSRVFRSGRCWPPRSTTPSTARSVSCFYLFCFVFTPC